MKIQYWISFVLLWVAILLVSRVCILKCIVVSFFVFFSSIYVSGIIIVRLGHCLKLPCGLLWS